MASFDSEAFKLAIELAAPAVADPDDKLLVSAAHQNTVVSIIRNAYSAVLAAQEEIRKG